MKWNKTRQWVLLAFVLGSFQGCTALNQDARLNFLEGQMKDVFQKSAEWDITSKDARKKVADYGAQIDSIQEQIQILAGQIEEAQAGSRPRENPLFQQQGLPDEVRRLTERLQFVEARVAELEGKLSAQEPSTLAAPLTSRSEERSAAGKPSSEIKNAAAEPPKQVKSEPQIPEDQKAYEQAMDAMKKKQYEKAIRQFRDFIKKFPDHDLSDNSQYWIGECYYAQAKYEEAIIEFEEVIQQYPKGDKVPAALLKEGLAFQELKDNNPARQILNKLVDQYPDSEEAKLARTKLKGL